MITRFMLTSIIGLTLLMSFAVSENVAAQVYYRGGYYVPRPQYVGAKLRYLPSPYRNSTSYTYDPVYTYSYRPYYPGYVYRNYRPYYYRRGTSLYYGPRGTYVFSYRR